MKLIKFNKGQSLSRLDGNKNNNKTKRRTIVICSIVLVFAILYFSFARFESNYNFQLINGHVEYPTMRLIDKIATLAANGATDLAYDGTDALGTVGTSDNNLRYIGNDPNNFVSLNCDVNGENCDKWRIIGVFNNVTTPYDTQTLVKITTAASIGAYSWDSSASTINQGEGINQWGVSGAYEGADLMRELNTDYLGNTTIGTDGKWFYGTNNSKTAAMPTRVINIYDAFIQEVIWKTGSNPSTIELRDMNSNRQLYAKDVYDFERGSETSNMCSIILDEDFCNDTVTRTATWQGYVALPYYSDYTYSIADNNQKTRAQCLAENNLTWTSCNTSWLYSSYYNGRTTTTPIATFTRINNGYNNGILIAGGMYNTAIGKTSTPYKIRPTIYLQNHVLVVGGNGTEENPYRLQSGGAM